MPRVLCIGSCRVRRPLRRAHAAGLVELVNDTGAAWFTHSGAEAIQYVRALRGEVTLPQSHRGLICEAADDIPEELATPGYLEADVAVVELCTLKSVTLDGYFLNVQMVSSLAGRTEGVTAQAVLRGRAVEWPGDLAHMRRISVATYTTERFREEVSELRDLLRIPLIVVDHIPALTAAGEVVPDRARLSSMLRDVCESLGVTFLPTTELMGEWTIEAAASDTAHWSKDFEGVAGTRIAGEIARTLEGSLA